MALIACGAQALFSPAAVAQGSTTLPAVTVTAEPSRPLEMPATTGTNLDLTPLQTPASTETVTRQQLESRTDTSLVDAITRTTGITSMGHPGNSGTSLSARGFTDTTSVMRLYDGMRQYGGVGLSFPFHTWAIDRIEVLRGPASVLHGDGAIGAVINVVPKKPSRGPVRSEAQAIIGTDGRQGLAFGSGGALDERLSFRLDVSGDRGNGWVDRGDWSNQAFSGALRLDVSSGFRLTLSHAQGTQKPMAYFGSPLINGSPVEALRSKNYNVSDGRIEYRDRWTDLSAEWTPTGNTRVRSRLYHVRSHRYWHDVETYNHNPASGLIDRLGATEIRHDQVQTGNTTDLTVTHTLFGLPSQSSVGFDVNHSTFQHTNNTYTGAVTSVDPYNFDPGVYASPFPYIPRYRTRANQYALFAENRLSLTDRWSVTAGLRRDNADLDRTDLVTSTQAFDRSYGHTGWRLGTVYQLQSDSAVYAQVAKAADPIASLLLLSTANSAFDMSHGRQVEVGYKQALPDRRGYFSLALYEIEKNNLLSRDPVNPSLRQQVGQRSSRGIEGTFSWSPLPSIQIDANAALLRARYDDFIESVGGVAVSRNGNVPTDVPQRVANLWVGWKARADWTLGGGLRYVGKRFADNANTSTMPAYSTFDLALQWRPARDTAVTLRGVNVFDRYYFTTSYYTPQWLVGEGRRFELVLNQRF